VVALYGVDSLVAFARKDRAAGRRAALAATALVILFFVLNPELIPRWQRRVSFQMDRRPLDTPAAKSWTDFLHFQGLPWWPWAFVVLPFLRSRPGNARLALFLFVGVPVFAVAANHLIPVRLKPRYFSPFLGLGFACLCLTLDTLGRRRGFLGAAALAVALGAGLAPERVPESIAGLLESPWPPANASAGYRVSRSLQSVGLPAVWLSAHGERGYGPVIDGFHWALVGDPKAPPALFLPLRDKGPGSAWGRLPPFLRRHGDVLVVLQRGGRRFRCPEPPEDARLRVVEVRLADRCLVLVRGVREIDQVRRLARAVSDTLEPRPGRRRRLDAG
jgi:hypothetical protein